MGAENVGRKKRKSRKVEHEENMNDRSLQKSCRCKRIKNNVCMLQTAHRLKSFPGKREGPAIYDVLNQNKSEEGVIRNAFVLGQMTYDDYAKWDLSYRPLQSRAMKTDIGHGVVFGTKKAKL